MIYINDKGDFNSDFSADFFIGQTEVVVPRTYTEADSEGIPADFNNDFNNQ